MTRKTTALYEAVFRVVQELVPHFQPSQVSADFVTAARAVFGNNLVVSGCRFHFAQALVKRICANWGW